MKYRFKFRVFDKKTKIFLNDFLVSLYPIHSWLKHGWIVEQCTGLKDKNGKLIYEGDIIELTDDDSFEKPKKTIVHWVKGDACFGLLATNKLYYGFAPYECENFEVIGNIHENLELLKER